MILLPQLLELRLLVAAEWQCAGKRGLAGIGGAQAEGVSAFYSEDLFGRDLD